MAKNVKTVIVIGGLYCVGGLLVRRLLRNGYQVKAPDVYVYKDGLSLGGIDLTSTIAASNLSCIGHDWQNPEKLTQITAGCDIVVYLADNKKDNPQYDYNTFVSLVEASKSLGVSRFVYISDSLGHKDSAVEFLKQTDLGNFTVCVIDIAKVVSEQSAQKAKLDLDIVYKNVIRNQKITIYNDRSKYKFSCQEVPDRWYDSTSMSSSNPYIRDIVEICLYILECSLGKVSCGFWLQSISYMNSLKRFKSADRLINLIKNPYRPIYRRFKALRRQFNIAVSAVLLHCWPEQVYKFTNKKILPDKGRRHHRKSRPPIPYELIKEKTGDIPKMKEANLVLRGASFDIKKLDSLTPPIFLSSFWEPVQTQKDVIYLNGHPAASLKFAQLGYKSMFFEVNCRGYDGNLVTTTYMNIPGHEEALKKGTYKRISLFENIYCAPPKPPGRIWAPANSGLPAICALSYFAEKVNVYGWDFYLNGSPRDLSYWQLYFKLFEWNMLVSHNRPESSIINFYYGYWLSKMPNFNICGYLGQLQGHQKLIGKLERVLFNK